MKRKFLCCAVSALMIASQIFGAMPASAATAQEEQQIHDAINAMTLRQKIGQMLMPDIRQWQAAGETKVTDLTVLNSEVSQIIDDYDLGGVILFANNVQETNQTAKLVYDLQDVVINDTSNDIPLFITVDQEGGIVTRLGTGTQLPGNMALGATDDPDNAYKAGQIIGKELNSLGININFAPTLDVNNNPANPVINVRSFGEDPDKVGVMGAAMIKGIAEQGVGVTAKHFPGHGDTASDSHYGLPIVDKSKAELMELELKPFKAAIDAGLDMIMTAHIGMPQIESETFGQYNLPIPATLSRAVLTGLLRGDLGYDGVIVTDAMNMNAISDNFTEPESTVKAIKAGVDIVLMPTILRSTADIPKLEAVVQEIEDAVNNGDIPLSQIDASVFRILRLKVERGIWTPGQPASQMSLNDRLALANSVVGCAEHLAIEAEIADKSITLVKNDRSLLPLELTANDTVLIVGPNNKSLLDSVFNEIDRLQKNGSIPKFTATRQSYVGHLSADQQLMDHIDAADYVVYISNVSNATILNPNNITSYSGTEIIEYTKNQNKPVVLLSSRIPYDGAVFTDANAHLVSYGNKGNPNGPDSESNIAGTAGPNIPAAVRTIFGVNVPSGKLPVSMPKVIEDATSATGYSYSTTDYYRNVGYGIQNFTSTAVIEPNANGTESLVFDGTAKVELPVGSTLTEDTVGFYVDVAGTKVNGDLATGDVEIIESVASGKYLVSGNTIYYYTGVNDGAPSVQYDLTSGLVFENGVLTGVIDTDAIVQIAADGAVSLSSPVQPLPDFTITEKYQDENGNSISADKTTTLNLGSLYDAKAIQISDWNFSRCIINGADSTSDTVKIESLDKNMEIIFVYKKVSVPASSHKVTEKYVDEKGNVVAKETQTEVTDGGKYSKAVPAVSGWVFSHYVVDNGAKQTDKNVAIDKVSADHTITFVYKKSTSTNTNNNQNNQNNKTPTTGDNNTYVFVALGLLILSASVITVMVIARKKGKHHSK